MANKAFAAVDTLPKATKAALNPRATRYGIAPIWDVPTSAKDFYVWTIPANTVFPFRPFTGEVIRDLNDKILGVNERMPEDQILDMYNMTQFFVELEPLARLNDEVKAERIVAVLANPNSCEKYPIELGVSCATCWLKDSLTDAEDRIKEAFKEEADMRKAARECLVKLRDALSKAIDEARRKVDVAVRDIDDPKSGKSMFFPADYLNVYHTHADRPTYKTSTSNGADIGNQIAEAIGRLAKKDEPAPAVDIAALVAAAVAEATKDLKEELASYKAKEEKKEAIKEKLKKD